MSHQQKKSKPKINFPYIKYEGVEEEKAIPNNRRWITTVGKGISIALIFLAVGLVLILGIHKSLKSKGKLRKQLCITRQRIEFNSRLQTTTARLLKHEPVTIYNS